MDQAIKFAREILRKRAACYKTKSVKLKHDYNKSIQRDMNDLIYYASKHKLNMSDILYQAINSL